jgi:hypothetical protein
MSKLTRWPRAAIVLAGLVLLGAACSSDGSPSSTPSSAAPTAKQAAVDVSAVVRRPVPVGGGVAQSSASATSTAAAERSVDRSLVVGYAETEYLVEGTAATYSGPATGPAKEGASGVPFVTRVLVRSPKDARSFSGRVVLEPFNTSGGADADVVWSSVAPMLQAEGDAWVGVTERASSEAKLKAADAVRYAEVHLPSNDVAWDILRQVGAVLKVGGEQSPLGSRRARHLYMAGYSQSGLDTATFAMAFGGRTGTANGAPVYDGFFPAAHSGSVTPLRSGTAAVPTFEHPVMTAVPVPVVDLETQSDVEGFKIELGGSSDYTNPAGASVRRADSDTPADRYRLYEIAGAPHAGKIPSCDGDGSTFPTHRLLSAALGHLFRWAEDGVRPPRAPRLEMAKVDVVSETKLDQYGNAVGGVRSPWVDVPVSHYEVHSTPGPLCKLSSRETVLPLEGLRARYGDASGYLKDFTKSLDAAIDAGFLRRSERSSMLEVQRARAAEAFAER